MNEEAAVLQAMFPVAPVSLCGSLPQAQEGVRYHVATDGLWREVNTAWLAALAPVATTDHGITPFGALKERVDLRVCPPKHLWGEFLAQAKAAFPQESASVFAWNAVDDSWRHVPRTPETVTDSYIAYQEPSLGTDEIPVVDIHSHGRHSAHFSSTDDKDDAGGIKVSVVLGNVDGEVTLACRLVVLNHFYQLSMDGDGGWLVGSRV